MQKYNLLPEHLNYNLKNFIVNHLNDNKNTLTLKLKSLVQTEYCTNLVLDTLFNYKKALHKLPTLALNYCWLPTKSYEQSSSELTAFYKSSKIKGNNLLDLCGGLGIDDIYFAKNFKNVISLDIDNELNTIVKYNFSKLKISNIERITSFAEDFLDNNSQNYDLIYIDADRRPEANAKTFNIEECTPNIIELLPKIKTFTGKLLIKLSPLVDITYIKNAVEHISTIEVVSVKNEVKEVLLWLDFKTTPIEPSLMATNIIDFDKTQHYESTKQSVNESINNTYIQYFFEPNSSIIKAQLSNDYAIFCKLKMLGENSHFFIGDEVPLNFMGRSFKIVYQSIFSKSNFLKYLKSTKLTKANISKRNFPITEAEIAKQFKLTEGGNDYLFFSQNNKGEKLFFHCKKLID